MRILKRQLFRNFVAAYQGVISTRLTVWPVNYFTSSRVMTAKNTSDILCRLRAVMQNTNHVTDLLDAYIVPMEDAHQSEYIASADKRIRFVSGFSGSRALAVVTQSAACLWTDGRYFIQAQQQMDANWTLQKEGKKETPLVEKWITDTLEAGSKVGVDPYLIASAKFRDWQKEFALYKVSLLAVYTNLVDIVWANEKPPTPTAPLTIVPVSYAGVSWQEKVRDIREELKKNNAKLLVLSALDEIAWTFNLRGSDIDYNPVFFSYAIIGLDFVSLFLSESKVTEGLKQHLHSETDSVTLLPYDSIRDYLDQYTKTLAQGFLDKVWLPADSTSEALAAVIPSDKSLIKSSPIQLMKAVKNRAELKGIRNAHIKDGVSHAEFIFWLEQAMASQLGNLKPSRTSVDDDRFMTEMSVASRFEELRRQQAEYVSLSFPTISAVGAHAASPHYSLTAESNAEITHDRIYLVDSGAHYRDGTTDVTRTLCFDEPTAFQRKANTLVLKGHIALASQKFPENVAGIRLDTLARFHLWNQGLDYQHGTGHGVGHFLNVHEGPGSIGYRKLRCSTAGIRENMVFSIEPGYYEADQFGIRIENLYVVISTPTEHQFDKNLRFCTFEPLTLVPIQTKLLDPSLLDRHEIDWLNDYHSKVFDTIGPVLENEGKHEVFVWLREQCRPLG